MTEPDYKYIDRVPADKRTIGVTQWSCTSRSAL